MQLEDCTHSGGIRDTNEWKLLYWLWNNSQNFASSRPQSVPESHHSSKSKQLHNAIQSFNIEIRLTFTILKLDLILCLEDEGGDDTSQTSSGSEDESSSQASSDSDDSDYAASSPLARAQSKPQSDHQPHSLRHMDPPSSEEAMFRLESICSLLEARVNHLLVSARTETDAQSEKYPRLSRLNQFLAQTSTSPTVFEFIPSYGCASDGFLFNIAEDKVTANAFVAFADPRRKRPHGDLRRQMLTDASYLTSHFRMFNDFVNKLQLSPASLSKIAVQPNQEAAMKSCLPMITQLHRFRRQLATAYRAILSHIRTCSLKNAEDHNILLQLPGKEHVDTVDPGSVQNSRPVQIFFTLCSKKDWQLAKMSFLLPGDSKSCRQPRLCDALHSSYVNDVDLEFYVSEDLKASDHEEIPIQVPTRPARRRTYTASFPNKDSLRNLINGDLFANQKTISMKNLSLARLPHSGSIDDNEGYLKPIPQFTSLAKILLQVLLGEHPPRHISKQSQLPTTSWKSLRRTIDLYVKEVGSRSEINQQVIPFLQATLGCLDFHLEYQHRVRQVQSKRSIDVAWEVAFDTILSKIDDKLPRNLPKKDSASSTHASFVPDGSLDASTSMSPRTYTDGTPSWDEVQRTAENVSLARVQSSQSNVLLFDTNHSSVTTTAPEFWKLLEKFHKSYSRYLADRNMSNGEESSRRIRVAILDTGIDFKHPAIIDAMKNGRVQEQWCQSWIGAKSDVSDEDKHLHGTNCVTLLHKSSPEADIYVAKVFRDNSVRFYEAENIAKAIRHASDVWKVDIISMSFGLRRPEARADKDKTQESLALKEYQRIVDDIETAIIEASNKGRYFFAAASNDGMNKGRAFPASYESHVSSVFPVHASDGNGQDGGINPAADSSFQLMTLGMGIELSEKDWVQIGGRTFPKYKIVLKSGTSFATPIAAGIAATVLDLTSRVEAIEYRAKRKIRRPGGLKTVLQLMAKRNGFDGLYYMAPWLHWEDGWETDESVARSSWDAINRKFW
ncbi:hypothetical protein E8E14_007547 [Neopestalotiopsis sp. 37M]|nr:hypothetical protein E8E14_007547 [Neopestalotiopsis sp. 37M]